MAEKNILTLREIDKSFPGVVALSRAQLTLRKGEIHALMGENGAGKSTLIKCLTGVHERDGGEIRMEGMEGNLFIHSTQEAQKKGISQGYMDFLRSETPRHPVRIAKPFYLGMHEITQGQYQKVMRVNPSRSGALSDTSPVESVSWDEAMDFCRLLSELPEEKAVGRVYRLPSEAEWEYACRAGSQTGYHFGQEPASLDRYGWFAKDVPESPHPVGGKQPNPWGLFDLYGIVGEWCRDWFAEDSYRQASFEDPIGPKSGKGHVVRGGSFREAWPGALRSAFRAAYPANSRNDTIGFRVVCTASKKRSP
jgi:formylglycine-generating enzyme required for sulfatase activity